MTAAKLDTAGLVSVALQAHRKTGTLGKQNRLTADQVDATLDASGRAILEVLSKGSAVSVPRLGVFSPAQSQVRPAPNPRSSSMSSMSSSSTSSPMSKSAEPHVNNLLILSKCTFVLSTDFVQSSGGHVRMRRGSNGGPRSSAVRKTTLNLVQVSRYAGVSKDTCRRALESVVWALARSVSSSSDIALTIPHLGTLMCRKGVCDFAFGHKNTSGTHISNQQLDQQDDAQSQFSARTRGTDSSDASSRSTSSGRSLTSAAASGARKPPSLERLKQRLLERAGCNALNSFGSTFRVLDTSKDNRVSLDELQIGLKRLGVRMNPIEIEEIFNFLDTDGSKSIVFDELLVGLRGDIPAARLRFIREAYKLLDANCDGIVTVSDLEMMYDPSMNPDVMSGRLTKAEALRSMLDTFDSGIKDGVVTLKEFETYYKNISASIDRDDYFELMMRNAWRISGGHGQSANTANKRELITDLHGKERVAQTELGLFKMDKDLLSRRAANQQPFNNGPTKQSSTPRRASSVNGNDNNDNNNNSSSNISGSPADAAPPRRTRASYENNLFASPSTRLSPTGNGVARPRQSSHKNVSNKAPKRRVGRRLSQTQHVTSNPITGELMVPSALGDEALPQQPPQPPRQVAADLRRMSTATMASVPLAGERQVHSEETALDRLARLLFKRRMTGEDLLLRIGGNRVFGSCSVSTDKFIKNLPVAFPNDFSEDDARAIVNLADVNMDAEIDVNELCSRMIGCTVVDRIRAELARHVGVTGIQAAQVELRRLCAGSNDACKLGHLQVKSALERTCLITLSSAELDALFAYFDANGDGALNMDELIHGLRGGRSMSNDRQSMVRCTFKGIDRNRKGAVRLVDLQAAFNSAGKADDAFVKTMALFDTAIVDGVVYESEFIRFYSNVSALVPDDDDEFSELLRDTWTTTGEKRATGDDMAGAGRGRRQSQSQSKSAAAKELFKAIKDRIIARAGADGIQHFARSMRVMDRSRDKKLDVEELTIGLRNMGLRDVADEDVRNVFRLFDCNHDDSIDFDEFLQGLRGSLNKRRRKLVEIAFKQLDRDGSGAITVEEIEDRYDATFHPDVKTGRIKKRDAIAVLLGNFESPETRDGRVTYEEFCEYYANVSASIDTDDYFELMMRNAWHLSGGSGQYENTTNRRVLISDARGNQRVQEVKNDFLMGRNDIDAIRARLREQNAGVDVGEVGLSYADKGPSTTPGRAHINDNNNNNNNNNILAWDDNASEADTREWQRRFMEKEQRNKAANSMQNLARTMKAKKGVDFMRRKARARAAQAAEAEAQRTRDQQRAAPLRPKGSNWY